MIEEINLQPILGLTPQESMLIGSSEAEYMKETWHIVPLPLPVAGINLIRKGIGENGYIQASAAVAIFPEGSFYFRLAPVNNDKEVIEDPEVYEKQVRGTRTTWKRRKDLTIQFYNYALENGVNLHPKEDGWIAQELRKNEETSKEGKNYRERL